MSLYLDKILSVALKAQSDGNAPPKTDIFALMTFFWKAFHIVYYFVRKTLTKEAFLSSLPI